MATTIELGKLNDLFNRFLSSSLPNFFRFLIPTYATATESGLDFNDGVTHLDSVASETILGELNAENASKFGDYLTLLGAIKGSAFNRTDRAEADRLGKQIIKNALKNRLSLKVDEEVVDGVEDAFGVGKGKIKLQNRHPKAKFVGKKFGIPAGIAALVGGIIGIAIAAALSSGVAIAAIPFMTGNTLLNALSIGSSLAVLAAGATVIGINVKDAIVKRWHARKGTKSKSNSMVFESEGKIEDLKNIPVLDMLNKYLEVDSKLIDKNAPFRQYRVAKSNRNRLHAIIDHVLATEKHIKDNQKLIETDDVSTKKLAKALYPNRSERKKFLKEHPDLTDEALINLIKIKNDRLTELTTYMRKEMKADMAENMPTNHRNWDIYLRHLEGLKDPKKREARARELEQEFTRAALTNGLGNNDSIISKRITSIKANRNEVLREKSELKAERNERSFKERKIAKAGKDQVIYSSTLAAQDASYERTTTSLNNDIDKNDEIIKKADEDIEKLNKELGAELAKGINADPKKISKLQKQIGKAQSDKSKAEEAKNTATESLKSHQAGKRHNTEYDNVVKAQYEFRTDSDVNSKWMREMNEKIARAEARYNARKAEQERNAFGAQPKDQPIEYLDGIYISPLYPSYPNPQEEDQARNEEAERRAEEERQVLLTKTADADAARKAEQEARIKAEQELAEANAENEDLKKNQKFDLANMSDTQNAYRQAKVNVTIAKKTIINLTANYREVNEELKDASDERTKKALTKKLAKINEEIALATEELNKRIEKVADLEAQVKAEKAGKNI